MNRENVFVDASVIVAILNEEPGFEELEKRLEGAGKRYVSALTRYEAVSSLVRIEVERGRKRSPELARSVRVHVNDFLDDIGAQEIVIDSRISTGALDVAEKYGKMAGHKADLNFGDCFAYSAATVYRLKLLYKGDDFAKTDLR